MESPGMGSSRKTQVSFIRSHFCLTAEGKDLSKEQWQQELVPHPQDLLVSASSESFATSPAPLPLPGITAPRLIPVSGWHFRMSPWLTSPHPKSLHSAGVLACSAMKEARL